jgi:hypothetical protein
VNKWEKFGGKVTNMDINIEKILRLYIHEKIGMKTHAQKHNFYKKYLELSQLSASNKKVGRIQIEYAAAM